MSISIKKLPKSIVEIEGEISAEDFERHYQSALKEMNEKSSIPGFRSGHIPENILIEKLGEGAIMEHAAEHALKEAYPKIAQEHKIRAVGHPQVAITKIARKNPLGFKATTAVLPEIKLPNYKNITSSVFNGKVPTLAEKEDGVPGASRVGKNEIAVEEKEIDGALEFLRNSKSQVQNHNSQTNSKSQTKKQDTEKNLLEINDEFAKKFGQPNLMALRATLRENILRDKKIKAREKNRMEMLDKISALTPLEIPDVLIQSEKEKMAAELRSSIENMGLEWAKYLEHLKKTEDDLKKDWSGEAEKRARYALILREIANTESIEPTETELNDFAEKTIAQYPESERAKIDKARLKDYAYGILRNEKVFQLLENQNG